MWKFNSDIFQSLACQKKIVCGLAEKCTRMEEGITIRTIKVNEKVIFHGDDDDDDDDDDGEEVTASIFKVTIGLGEFCNNCVATTHPTKKLRVETCAKFKSASFVPFSHPCT